MTCKDCVHDDVCEHWKNSVFGSDALYPKENDCEHFKNKADFVEVVRCGKCRYCDEEGRCENPVNGLIREYVTHNDFCSYGKRRDE